MRKTGPFLAASMILGALAAGLLLRTGEGRIGPTRPDGAEASRAAGPAPAVVEPALYCVFTNFADRSPLVGFNFRIGGERVSPTYALIFQREQDGSQIEFGGQDRPSPEWAFDGSQDPAVIRAPEDSMQINLYGYDPAQHGTHWFEAGLRSVRYKNVGGRCRLSV